MACHDCERPVPCRTCETHNPKGARICKNCCIVKMKGMACRWFDLCW